MAKRNRVKGRTKMVDTTQNTDTPVATVQDSAVVPPVDALASANAIIAGLTAGATTAAPGVTTVDVVDTSNTTPVVTSPELVEAAPVSTETVAPVESTQATPPVVEPPVAVATPVPTVDVAQSAPEVVPQAPEPSTQDALSRADRMNADIVTTLLGDYLALMSKPISNGAGHKIAITAFAQAIKRVLANPTDTVLDIMYEFFDSNKHDLLCEHKALRGIAHIDTRNRVKVETFYTLFRKITIGHDHDVNMKSVGNILQSDLVVAYIARKMA